MYLKRHIAKAFILAALAVALSTAAALVAPSVAAAADFQTSGTCRGATAGYRGAGIEIDGTTVSVINESPLYQDSQSVVRDLYLYRWLGGSTWQYTGTSREDTTRVGEAPYWSNTMNPTSSSWWTASGWSTPYIAIPFNGQVYAIGLQLRWYSQRTGQVVGSYWNPQISQLLQLDSSLNYVRLPYCDYRNAQIG
jgi:hypothetical protein